MIMYGCVSCNTGIFRTRYCNYNLCSVRYRYFLLLKRSFFFLLKIYVTLLTLFHILWAKFSFEYFVEIELNWLDTKKFILGSFIFISRDLSVGLGLLDHGSTVWSGIPAVFRILIVISVLWWEKSNNNTIKMHYSR